MAQKNSLLVGSIHLFEPRRDKTCLRGFPQSEIQSSLLSYRDLQEKWNILVARLDMNNSTLQKANNKGPDQSAARMRKLVYTFVLHKPQRQVFLCQGQFDVVMSSHKAGFAKAWKYLNMDVSLEKSLKIKCLEKWKSITLRPWKVLEF